MPREKTPYEEFRTAWEDAAELGYCDAPHGAEYSRVFRAWLKDGSPEPCGDFIERNANRPTKGRGEVAS